MSRVLLLLCLFLTPLYAKWQSGDIIFTSGNGAQAQAVKAATGTPWTHTAVIFVDQSGKPMVFEAVQPVQLISLDTYLARGGEGTYHEFKRLKNTKPLTPEVSKKAMAWAKTHLGKNYDGRFQWSDQTLYCSELVWKLYKECAGVKLCKLKQVKDYDLKHLVVSALIQQRFGSIERLNLNEKIVAPSDIYDSPLLISIKP